jgi:hypothetical protein
MVVNLNLGCRRVHKITQMHFFEWNLELMESQWHKQILYFFVQLTKPQEERNEIS